MYMFYLVGLGLFDHKDISLKGLECLKNVDKIYAEFFTSRLFGSSFEAIEELVGQEIEVLVRGEVEEEHKFIEEAKSSDVALITGGDPLIATTHSDFLVQCVKKGIDYEVKKLSMMYSGRFVAENEGADGLCKIIVDKAKRTILGVHLIGTYAGEMIWGAAQMLEMQLRVNDARQIIFPHPTVSEIIRETLWEFSDK